MSKNPLFDFDLSVASDKKRRSRGNRSMSGASETSQRTCEHKGCGEPGKYRAPKSSKALDEYFWFCKRHIRDYNQKWNFFKNHTDEEYERQVDSEKGWGRPTKPFGDADVEKKAWSRLGIDDPAEILGDNATRSRQKADFALRKLPGSERRALSILDARESWTKTRIRNQYKALVKDLHPDMNEGARADEERLQQVVWAWNQIKGSKNFQD